MNHSPIHSLRQKFQKRIESIKNSDFNSLQQSLLDLWAFFDKQLILTQIAKNLMSQTPKASEKSSKIFSSPSTNPDKGSSELESIAIAFWVLHAIAKVEKNKLRGNLRASVGTEIFAYQNLSQNDLDEKITNVFKNIYFDKFHYYVDEQLEGIESQNLIVEPTKNMQTQKESGKVFIGHGRSFVWRDLKDFLQERLHLPIDEFNRESVAGLATKERLETMLENSSFAFLIMTAEDEHADQTLHARENVIHEIGLFQGRLGFRKAIILFEEGCQEFSNIFGLTQIRFPKGNIKAEFEEIRRVLEREGMIENKNKEIKTEPDVDFLSIYNATKNSQE